MSFAFIFKISCLFSGAEISCQKSSKLPQSKPDVWPRPVRISGAAAESPVCFQGQSRCSGKLHPGSEQLGCCRCQIWEQPACRQRRRRGGESIRPVSVLLSCDGSVWKQLLSLQAGPEFVPTASWLTMVLDTLLSIISSSYKARGQVFPWFLHVSAVWNQPLHRPVSSFVHTHVWKWCRWVQSWKGCVWSFNVFA